MPRRFLAVALAASLFCCGDSTPPWAGTYSAEATWDLTAPLGGGRTVGDVVADVLVEQIVALLGVPSLLEDQIYGAVSKVVRAPVKAVVDGQIPPELAPGGDVYALLSTVLATLRSESTVVLEKGLLPGSMKGDETFSAFVFVHEGKTTRITVEELAGMGVTVSAEWGGREDGASTLAVDAHDVEIRFGELVRRVVTLLLDAAKQEQLKQQVLAAVGCEPIVKGIVGNGTGLTISVEDWSKSISTADLTKACGKGSDALAERVLGLFAVSAKVRVGGPVQWSGDPAATLKSGDGFGGVVLVGPAVIAPRTQVRLSAVRK